MSDWFTQDGYGVRFGWGPDEARVLSHPEGATVIVDVLSFTTAVSVVVDNGGVVYPYRWRDETAADYARQLRAELASSRRQGDDASPWSLSPAALRDAPAVDRLVLPSPNGATIAASVDESTVVAACLRNATATAAWLGAQGFGTVRRPVAVIAAGERWPHGGLRPALEDLLGAGAVLSALAVVPGAHSPEAAATRAVFRATTDVADAVRGCGSGVELTDRGFAADVDVALEVDASTTVPVIVDGGFTTVAS
ncbi:MAG: 2-phosphosulfolactate phosphatase [Stackebrandtia sp.]